MVEKTNLRSLREIVSAYPIVLIDTSVLSNSCLRERRYPTFIEEKEIEVKEQKQFLDLLTGYIEKGGSYFITEPISKEYLGGHYPYKKIIRLKSVQQNRRELDLCRKKRDQEKERKGIINIFKKNDRILKLDAREHYLCDEICKRYPKLFNYRLSDVDLKDFLVPGLVISQTRKPVGLASNDLKIARAWRYIARKKKISLDQFGFFVRIGMNSFKSWEDLRLELIQFHKKI